MDGPGPSLLATVTLTWAVIYGYVAWYAYALHRHRPADPELRPFATATLGMTVYACGCALLTDQGTTAGVTMAYRMTMSGAALAAGGFMHFAHALSGRAYGHAVWATYAVGAVALVLIHSGAMFDPGLPAKPHPMLWEGHHPPLVPTTTWSYALAASAFLVAVVRAAWIMRTPRLGAPERFWLSVTSIVLVVAAVHDTVINVLPWRSVYLLEHAYLLCALAMTHHLLGRVARTDVELVRRTEQLEQSLADLHRTETELARKEQLAAVGELSAIVAHDVRTPITIMQDALTRLAPAAAETNLEAHRGLLERVEQASDRLNQLVGDLLTYAKPLHTQVFSVPLAAMVERAASTLSPESKTRVVVATPSDGVPTHIECDPELLHQALRNVLQNTIDTTPMLGRITVATSRAELRATPAVALTITGASDRDGQPSGDVPPRNAGTGLALAIVDRVVRAHRGHLEVRVVGGSAQLVLTLPLRAETTDAALESGNPVFRASWRALERNE